MPGYEGRLMDDIGDTVTSGGENTSLQPSLHNKLYIRYLQTDRNCKHVINIRQLRFLRDLFKLNYSGVCVHGMVIVLLVLLLSPSPFDSHMGGFCSPVTLLNK